MGKQIVENHWDGGPSTGHTAHSKSLVGSQHSSTFTSHPSREDLRTLTTRISRAREDTVHDGASGLEGRQGRDFGSRLARLDSLASFADRLLVSYCPRPLSN